jgi:cyclopropane fatty-acyl-phospholipid synthase-like methyltransferase
MFSRCSSALLVLKRVYWVARTIIGEHLTERRLGINTSEAPVVLADISANRDMHTYSPTKYSQLDRFIKAYPLSCSDVFVDIGCGKGRCVCFMARQNIKKAVGVEVDSDLVQVARKNAKRLIGRKAEISIVHCDASMVKFTEGTVFFMFNPFGLQTLRDVIRNISESMRNTPRRVTICYRNPKYQDELDKEQWLAPEGEIPGTEIWVWKARQ